MCIEIFDLDNCVFKMELDLAVPGERHEVQTNVEVLYSNDACAFVSEPFWDRVQIELHVEVKGHVFDLDHEIALFALVRFVHDLNV